jgi:chromosome segregation ATPase
MAKANEVPSSISSKHALNYDDMDDAISLKIKEEIVAFEYFMANLQGESKKHFGALMCQLGEANERLELIGKSERNAANKIADLENELEEEQEARAALEEQLETLEESQNESYSQIIKERDLARAKLKKLKKKQVEFEADHTRLKEDKERLEEAHKALERENSSLGESYELLQTQLAKYEMPSSSNPSCDHANIIEENARLKDELAKSSMAQCEEALDKIEGIQKPRNGKMGLGYVAKKKKNNKKKAKSTQAKKDQTMGGNATKGKTTHGDFAGITNPNYILYCDYYGDVYAKYVGPMDGYIDWSIWVPKTLVANKRGPIEKWVPKTNT